MTQEQIQPYVREMEKDGKLKESVIDMLFQNGVSDDNHTYSYAYLLREDTFSIINNIIIKKNAVPTLFQLKKNRFLF